MAASGLKAKGKSGGGLKQLEDRLIDMANEQAESAAYSRLFAVTLSVPRVRVHHLQKSLWVLNRRDCWAYAQAAAPFDVKQIIWQHEAEELGGARERGLDNHYALNVQQGEAFGLKPKDFTAARPSDGTLTCMHAWTHLAKDGPWLKSLAASAALELSNSDKILRVKSTSGRMARKIREELGIGMERQQSLAEHMVADAEHANLLFEVAERHATTELAQQQIIEGAAESWAIDRIFRDHLAVLMEAIPA